MDMQQMMRQAQKMQKQLADAQDRLADIEVSASAGGGMVKVIGTADMQITSITIDPDALDPEDIEMLQDLISAAFNEATKKVDDMMAQEMGKLTSGLGLPPGLL